MAGLFDISPVLTGRFALVALEQGIDAHAGGLTYGIPAELADLTPGERVIVPLGRGNKPAAGYVMALEDSSPLKSVKAILRRDPQGIGLGADLIELARWMAGYYCCPLGMVLATMLPAAVKRGTGTRTQTLVGLPSTADSTAPATAGATRPNAAGPRGTEPSQEPASPPPPRLSKQQQAVLAAARALAAQGQGWVLQKELADHAGCRSVAPVKQLVSKGLLAWREQTSVHAGLGASALGEAETDAAAPPVLNPDQQRAVQSLAERVGQGFAVNLLHGVTGSGKTEVYLRAIEQVLEGSGQATAAPPLGVIVLVPEIALTPQTVSRFVSRFGAGPGVAVLHSGLTAAQRHEQWRRIERGQVRIAVGARSAVFAPFRRLGLVIVDEEHESSYKQDQLPRYHARDVAIRRAQLCRCPVLLGSATPSLESYYNATEPGGGPPARPPGAPPAAAAPRYHLLRLPQRVAGLTLPKVEIIDLREERRKRYQLTGSAAMHLLSLRLEIELRRTLESKAQAILLLNRRGYAQYLGCPSQTCGWFMNCDYCDAAMVYHLDRRLPAGGLVRCHHCQAEQILPKVCPLCGKKVSVLGLGTQRVEEELAGKFPGLRACRMDSDTMRRGRDYRQTLESFRRREIDVLVGTQMIAKGLDFPNVRLVGVISADTALNLPDFRAAERTFQLIAQVAGRAGRGDPRSPGLVLVQTLNPSDTAIQLAARHDFEAFAAGEIATRAQVGLPPLTRMARIVVRHQEAGKCQAEAGQLAGELAAANEQMGLKVRVRGPAPCPIARVAGYHRLQIELVSPPELGPGPGAAAIQKLLTALRNRRLLVSDHRTAVDVDPVALM